MPENHVIVMQPTRVRLGDGRVIRLSPGLKSEQASERIRAALSPEKRALLIAKGRMVEDRPPWAP